MWRICSQSRWIAFCFNAVQKQQSLGRCRHTPMGVCWKVEHKSYLYSRLMPATHLLVSSHLVVILTWVCNATSSCIIHTRPFYSYYSFLDSIVTDKGFLFSSKFQSLLCYFLDIKRRLSTAFHPQTNSQIKRQNSTMEAYLRALVNFEQNDWARLLPMAEFAYNNAKNVSTSHTPFKFNYGYHPCVSFEEDTNHCSWSKTADKLLAKLQELMTICRENLHHAQELQKRAHDKGVKPKSYAPDDKVWLNSKYIKTKQNQKLEAKFFKLF